MMGNTSYTQLDPHNYSPALQSLFEPRQPAALRCFAVLEGITAGKIFTDDPLNPTWAVVQEAGFGTIYPGGDLPPAIQNQMIADLRLQGEVLIGLWPDDPRCEQPPPGAEYEG